MQKQYMEMNVKLPFKMIKRKNWYVAKCPVLDVSSQGENEKKAKENLIEALSVFLFTCIENGTLDAVLKECGFSAIQTPSRKKKLNIPKSEYVNIPIHLLTSQSRQSRCRA